MVLRNLAVYDIRLPALQNGPLPLPSSSKTANWIYLQCGAGLIILLLPSTRQQKWVCTKLPDESPRSKKMSNSSENTYFYNLVLYFPVHCYGHNFQTKHNWAFYLESQFALHQFCLLSSKCFQLMLTQLCTWLFAVHPTSPNRPATIEWSRGERSDPSPLPWSKQGETMCVSDSPRMSAPMRIICRCLYQAESSAHLHISWM